MSKSSPPSTNVVSLTVQQSVRLIKANAMDVLPLAAGALLAPIVIIFLGATWAESASASLVANPAGAGIYGVLFLLALVVVFSAGFGAVMHQAIERRAGRNASEMESLQVGLRKLPALLGVVALAWFLPFLLVLLPAAAVVVLLFWVGLLGGVMKFVAAGLVAILATLGFFYIFTRLRLALAAVFVSDLGALGALRQSWALSRGRALAVFVVMAIADIGFSVAGIVLVPIEMVIGSGIVGSVAGLVMGAAVNGLAFFAYCVVSVIAYGHFLPTADPAVASEKAVPIIDSPPKKQEDAPLAGGELKLEDLEDL